MTATQTAQTTLERETAYRQAQTATSLARMWDDLNGPDNLLSIASHLDAIYVPQERYLEVIAAMRPILAAHYEQIAAELVDLFPELVSL